MRLVDLDGKDPAETEYAKSLLKAREEAKSPLERDLDKAVNDYKNPLQTIATLPFNSTEKSLQTVQKYDVEITKAARDYSVEKEMVQAVLFQEMRFYNGGDPLADALVTQSYAYQQQLEHYAKSSGKGLGFPDAVIGYREDSSTGLGQAFAATAIEAYNFRYDTQYNPNNWKDLKYFWDKLQDDAYSIEATAMILAYKKSVLNDDLDREPTIAEIMMAYNGSGDLALKYMAVTSEYYKAFQEHNETCGLE